MGFLLGYSMNTTVIEREQGKYLEAVIFMVFGLGESACSCLKELKKLGNVKQI